MINFRGGRPLLYVSLLVLSVAGTYLFKLRTQGVFACTADGYYAPTSYLGYCDAKAYGDFDHGAFWFGLEPVAQRNAANAQVLFLGSSRMQFAFSTQATDRWFAAAAVPHYLMGFTHTENETFAGPMLAKLQPTAKVYVINVDRFFTDHETEPGADLLHNRNEVQRRYDQKALWQKAHRSLCNHLHALCGHTFAYYRNPETGHWKARGNNKPDHSPPADAPASDQDQWEHYGALARAFVAGLPVDRSCVVLTFVPYPASRRPEARAIAAAAGMELIEPRLEGLRTFDGSHLDPPSAEQFSTAFYQMAGPRILRCLGRDTAPPPAGT